MYANRLCVQAVQRTGLVSILPTHICCLQAAESIFFVLSTPVCHKNAENHVLLVQDTFTVPDIDTADPLTSARQTAFAAYLDSISKTNVYISAWNFLNGKGNTVRLALTINDIGLELIS